MPRRVTLFAGHYGSGKTNIAVNYALFLKKTHERVVIADLDIVNPYFRTRDSLEDLSAAGIQLISSAFASSNVDLPALPQEMYAVTDDKSAMAVVDIGGDDRGAYALGRYVPALLEEKDYDMLMVINRYRPLTTTAEDTVEVMREIEGACGLAFTGLCNNSNLGDATTAEDVLASAAYAEAVSRLSGLPLRMTTVRSDLLDAVSLKVDGVFPLTLQKKYY
ncbi:MAG: hypothetical protein IJJ23_04995 [Clostridia bacterium]|nr:hypothetical protein [Clostridia bacterium]